MQREGAQSTGQPTEKALDQRAECFGRQSAPGLEAAFGQLKFEDRLVSRVGRDAEEPLGVQEPLPN